MKPHALLLLAALALVAADKAKKPKPGNARNVGAKTDQELIQGKWVSVRMEKSGRVVTKDEKLTGSVFAFSENRLQMIVEAKVVHAVNFELDPKKNPRQISIIEMMGARTRLTKMIYKLESGTLTICHGNPSQPVPADFTTKKGDQRTLTVFKRLPKKKSQPKKD